MTVHIPILVEPIVTALTEPFLNLSPEAEPHYVVDCTLGGGGHTAAFLKSLQTHKVLARHRVLALDQDEGAVERAKITFKNELAQGLLEIAHARFSELPQIIGERPVLGLMADLGFSSDQIEDQSRGLSFMKDGPLDMRLDPSRGLSCREYLKQVAETELTRVLFEYGEERFSRQIARSIVDSRQKGALPETTSGLVSLVIRGIPVSARHGRIHAATRTFQALRIVVNEELEELDSLLEHGILLVKPAGRVAILSFHSLEDRKVKIIFKDKTSQFKQTTKKPIEASDEEQLRNPRSRSAKLRIAERVL